VSQLKNSIIVKLLDAYEKCCEEKKQWKNIMNIYKIKLNQNKNIKNPNNKQLNAFVDQTNNHSIF